MTNSKCDDLQLSVGQFLLPNHARAVVANAPDLSGRVVAIDICAVQSGEFIAIVNDATGQRPRFGMGMLRRGSNDGRRTQLAIEVKRMTSFIHAPPVILAAPDKVNRFPEV